MGEFTAWLMTLPSNQMFAGLTGATVIGGALVLARQLPVRIARWVLSGISAEVTVKSQDQVFWWIVNWLSESGYGKTARRMRLESTGASSDDAPRLAGAAHQSVASYVLSPADGRHWFFHRRTLVILQRGKENSGAAGHQQLREEITLRVMSFRGRAFLADLIDEARRSVASSDDSTKVYSNDAWNWQAASSVPRRPMESVILRQGVAEMLVQDADTFLKSKQWYRDRSIPWRRGYLLYGEPGCGKSSIAHALASHLRMNVAALSLASINGDAALRNLMNNMPSRCLLLIEDIDAAFASREGKESELVTFSGLLNAIDGIAAAEGRILVMTTNHADKIDPALRRPGRADAEVVIDLADKSQARRMFLRFFPDSEDLADAFAARQVGRSPSAIQGVLLANRADAIAACEHAAELEAA
jgi:chaperone BCS1